MSVISDVQINADGLKKTYKDLSSFIGLQIATKIIEIDSYRQVHVIDREGASSALEAITICLGISGQFSRIITDVLQSVTHSMYKVATATEEHESES